MVITVAKLFFVIGQRDAELSALTREVRANNDDRRKELAEIKSALSDLGKISADMISRDGSQSSDIAQLQREIAMVWQRLEKHDIASSRRN